MTTLVLRVQAFHYVQAGQALRDLRDLVKPGWLENFDSTVSTKAVLSMREILPALGSHCETLQLDVTMNMIRQMFAKYRDVLPTCQQAAMGIECIEQSFKAEIQSRVFMFVLPHRYKYFSDDALGSYGVDIIAALQALREFPDARFDIVEAGNCLAFERFTAAVYHLMRCAEFGLVSVAASLNVPEEKIGKGWDGCIRGIEHEIKAMSSTKPKNWQEDTKKYSDLCAWFTAMQKGWRNPISHIPWIYAEPTAAAMFAAVKTLFEHLSLHGFKQQPARIQLAFPSEE